MNTLLRPRFVAIDTSLLNEFARDMAHNQGGSNHAATTTLSTLYELGWIPFLTWHHLEEMIRHADETVVADRIAFLHRLPQLAWCSSRYGEKLLGSVVDLVALELQALVAHGEVEREHVKSALLRFGNADDIECVRHWKELRPLVQRRMQRERKVASIAHVAPKPIPDRPQLGPGTASPRPLQEVQEEFGKRAAALAEEIALHGDPRLADPTDAAHRFYAELFADQAKIRDAADTPATQLLASIGLSKDDVREDVSREELERIAMLKKRTKVAVSGTELDFNALWPTIRRANLPSELLQEAIRKGRQSAPRASGSDLADSSLASFCPYVDRVVVDKRTHEYLRQGCKLEIVAACAASAIRVASYKDLPAALENRSA